MSNTIRVECKVSSNTKGSEVYAFAFANVAYDLSSESNVDAFRRFAKTRPVGMARLSSNVTGLQFHGGGGEETFTGTLDVSFPDVRQGSVGTDVFVGEGFTNYVYCGVRDGVNKSLWTFSLVQGSTRWKLVMRDPGSMPASIRTADLNWTNEDSDKFSLGYSFSRGQGEFTDSKIKTPLYGTSTNAYLFRWGVHVPSEEDNETGNPEEYTKFAQWTQTENPFTVPNSRSAGLANKRFENLREDPGFSGLRVSKESGSTWVDGSTQDGYWFYALGCYGTSIPFNWDIYTDGYFTELYVWTGPKPQDLASL